MCQSWNKRTLPQVENDLLTINAFQKNAFQHQMTAMMRSIWKQHRMKSDLLVKKVFIANNFRNKRVLVKI